MQNRESSLLPDMALACGLHALARRHCIERAHHWHIQYSRVYARRSREASGYTDEELDIFPRSQVLEAMLEAIERHDCGALASFEAARGALLAEVWAAQNPFAQYSGAVEQSAMQDERRALARLIESAAPGQMSSVQPLFYRRTLSGQEVLDLIARLEARWDLHDQWFPIGALLDAPHASQEFRASEFEEYFGLGSLRNILLEHQIERVFEWREWGRATLLDAAQVEMAYTGAEGVWCDGSMQWVVYASHEGSLLLGGWIVDEVKRRWTGWHEHLCRPW